MADPPRPLSSGQLLAVNAELLAYTARMVMRLKARRDHGYLDLADDQVDTLARVASIEVRESVTNAYRAGRRVGRAIARLELGSPVDDVVRGKLSCPGCGQAPSDGTEDELPRPLSSGQLLAVNAELLAYSARLVARMKARHDQGYLDLADDQIETLARIAGIEARESVTNAYRAGRKVGRGVARLELGSPVDDIEPEEFACPGCGQIFAG